MADERMAGCAAQTGFPKSISMRGGLSPGKWLADVVQIVEVFLTVSTTHHPATDLGFLLHTHPDRVQQFKQSFGVATVFCPRRPRNAVPLR
jgi:hypothetical protein